MQRIITNVLSAAACGLILSASTLQAGGLATRTSQPTRPVTKQVTPDLLSAFGLGSSRPVSDAEGMTIRGKAKSLGSIGKQVSAPSVSKRPPSKAKRRPSKNSTARKKAKKRRNRR